MKTKSLITVFALLLFVTPITVMAAGSEDNLNGVGGGLEDNEGTESAKVNKKVDVKGASIDCSKLSLWRNHGEYVSCVARLHLGGLVTSEAARSNIGKKEEGVKSTTEGKIKSSEKRVEKMQLKEDKLEASISAESNAKKKESMIKRLESLIARLTDLLNFLKASK